MSLNWVMLPTPPTPTHPFIPLPNERTLFTSTPRVTFTLTTPKSTYPAHSANLSLNSSDGTLYLTNQRLIYLPASKSTITTNTATFKSFSAPLLNLHDTHLVMPWFGPNGWTALVQPVPGGHLEGIRGAGVELKVTFKDGGAPQFQGCFESVKERLAQVVELARERNGGVGGRGNGNVDLSNVHLDQLPSYQDHGQDRVASETEAGGGASSGGDDVSRVRGGGNEANMDVDGEVEVVVPRSATADEVRAMAAAAAVRREEESRRRRSREVEEAVHTPVEEPPGYEEAQHAGVMDQLADRLERT